VREFDKYELGRHVAERAQVRADEHGHFEPGEEAPTGKETGPAQAWIVEGPKGKAMVDLLGFIVEFLIELLAFVVFEGVTAKPRKSDGLGLV
jgi:hypothetical protein